MDRWKAQPGRSRARKKLGPVESQKGEDQRWRKSEERRCRCAKKVGTSRNTVFFPVFCGSGGSKSRLAKAAGAETPGQMRNEKLHASHFEVKSVKKLRLRRTSRSWAVEKVHAVVARSTFWSKKCQNTSVSDHFCKLSCWKSARRCGAKQISKSKVSKTEGFEPLFDDSMYNN